MNYNNLTEMTQKQVWPRWDQAEMGKTCFLRCSSVHKNMTERLLWLELNCRPRCFCKIGTDFIFFDGPKRRISIMFSFNWRKFWDTSTLFLTDKTIIDNENCLLYWFLMEHKFAYHACSKSAEYCVYVWYVPMAARIHRTTGGQEYSLGEHHRPEGP